MENVANFWKMAISSFVAAGVYVLRMFISVPKALGFGYHRVAEILALGYTIGLLIFIQIAYLCRTLANLVKKSAAITECHEKTGDSFTS